MQIKHNVMYMYIQSQIKKHFLECREKFNISPRVISLNIKLSSSRRIITCLQFESKMMSTNAFKGIFGTQIMM